MKGEVGEVSHRMGRYDLGVGHQLHGPGQPIALIFTVRLSFHWERERPIL
jgi:hypothetical protein